MTVMHLAVAGALATALLGNPARAASYLPCPDSALPGLAGTVCTNETVPAIQVQARAQPDSDLQLFVRKFPAAGVARGAVWLVAGGPGESGASLYGMVDTLRSAFSGFDLLVPDHRGTGYSSRLCPQEEAVGSPGGTALAGAEWGSCFQRLNTGPALAATFSLTQAAHDLRWLIANTPTKGPVYVYGVSYGTQLVLRALQVGQLPVAGVVLDSLVPLQTATAWDLSQRSQVVDMVGRNILSDCDRDPGCRASMGGSAEGAYRRLLALMEQQPAVAATIPGKNIKRFLGGMLDVPAARARIPYLIRDLEQGRREELDQVLAALTAASASLGAYPQSPPSVPLVSIISGSENNLRPDLNLEDLQREEQSLLFSSRLPELLVKPGLPLYPRDRYFGKVPDTLPPLLVLNGTRDPKTPFAGAVEHVTALRKAGPVSFVTVEQAPHFILWTAPQCFVAATRRFVEGGAVADQHCAM